MITRRGGYSSLPPGRIAPRTLTPVRGGPRRPQGRRPPNRPAQVGCLVVLLVLSFLVILGVIGSHLPKPPQPLRSQGKGPSQYVVSGRDPKAFVDAAAMFALPSQKRLDDLAAKTALAGLETSLRTGDPWSPHFWTQLDGWRGAGGSAQMVEALRHAAQKMAVPDGAPSRSKAVAAMQAFQQGNRHYEAGRFGQAIESYRVALKGHSAFWDAWNNVALAEMHSDNNLVALFLLSALTKNNPAYVGAAINLSVCLERLGQVDAARDLASVAAKEHPQIPMAGYNAAWFENSRGQYDSAKTFLAQALEPVSDYAVAKWLQTINSMESGRTVSAADSRTLPRGDPSRATPKIVSRPVTVATSAAATPGAMAVSVAALLSAMPAKVDMTPQTVPSSPMNGPPATAVDNTIMLFSNPTASLPAASSSTTLTASNDALLMRRSPFTVTGLFFS